MGRVLSQIESHFRGKGWLDKAYTYWFDEPDPKHYEFVVGGMQRLKTALVREARDLTIVPNDISQDLIHFSIDPHPILVHRECLARMIEQLELIPAVDDNSR